jgi:hypothetical protein
MRGSARLFTLVTALTLSVSSVNAQGSKPASGGEGSFKVGYTDIGPVIGLGGIGDAGISIGGRFERGIKALPSLNNGILGIEVGVDWYSYDFGGLSNYSLTYIPIGATANYHFQVKSNPKVDPFVGLGLGYYIVSFDCPGTACNNSYSNTVYFIGRVGMRYFLSSKLALYGDAGSGQGALHLGATFKIGGGD